MVGDDLWRLSTQGCDAFTAHIRENKAACKKHIKDQEFKVHWSLHTLENKYCHEILTHNFHTQIDPAL